MAHTLSEPAPEQQKQGRVIIPHLTVAKSAAIASVITKSILHPIDTLKCRFQVSDTKSFKAFFYQWRGKWSPSECYRGLGVKLAGYVPFQSIYMTAYNYSKTHFFEQCHGSETAPPWYAVIGSTLFADACAAPVRVPMEALKMRLQANVYDTAPNGFRRIFLGDGWRFTVSRLFVAQTLMHDVPYSITQFMCYENLRPFVIPYVRDGLKRCFGEESKLVNSGVVSMIAGYLSGCIAGAISTPVDVLKTCIVVGASNDGSAAKRISVRSAVRDVYRKNGVRGFFRGVSIRVLWISTNVGMYFAIFEMLKQRAVDGLTAKKEAHF